MASKKAVKQPAPDTGKDKVEKAPEKGYAGSQDHQGGNYNTDPSQATPERLREDRARQRAGGF